MKPKQRNWIITFVCMVPIIFLIDMWIFTEITMFIREPSDTSVVIGVVILAVAIFIHILLLIFIIKKTKLMKYFSILLLLSVVITSCTRIDAGYEGIRIQQYGTEKGVSDVTLVTGRVTYNPWYEDIEQMPLFVKTIDYDPFKVNAKDGSEFTVDPTVSLAVIQRHSPVIYRKYRVDLDEIIATTLYNYVKDAFRIQFNKFTTDDITGRREEFENNVQMYLVNQLEKEGFHLEQLTSGLKYPDMIVNAINAKNEAVQKAMQIENQVKAAEAQAKISIAQANGSAQALLIQAKADAEANRLKQQSLTALLVQQEMIAKWNGALPTYGAVPQLFKGVTGN